jgi:hypothetical protein
VAPLLETTPPSSTVTVDVALFPSTLAVIVAVPGATPATLPVFETVAFATSELDQEKTRGNAVPARSNAVAESWMLDAGTSVAVGAEIAMRSVVGGGGPVTLSPHEPISQANPIRPMERATPRRTTADVAINARHRCKSLPKKNLLPTHWQINVYNAGESGCVANLQRRYFILTARESVTAR